MNARVYDGELKIRAALVWEEPSNMPGVSVEGDGRIGKYLV